MKVEELDQFFTVQPMQVSERSDQLANPDQPDDVPGEIADDPEKRNAEVTGPVEEDIEIEAECGTSTVEAGDEGPPGGNDIGLRPSIISDQIREYLLKMGVSTLQYCNGSSSSAYSVQQPRKDRNIPRMSTTGLFRPKDYYAEVMLLSL